MIPDGWREVCFGDVAVLRNGLNYTSEDDQCSIRMIGVGAFQDNMIMDGIEGLPCISTASEIKDRDLINDDDLLFVRSNGNKQLIGRCMLIRPNGERVSHSGFTIRAIVQKEHLLPLYMAQLARTDIIKKAILLEGGGTNISNLSQKILSSLRLRLPPVTEQLDILHVLSIWDRAIEKTEALIEAKERRKAGLMQRLLTGKVRFGEEWEFPKAEDLFRNVSVKGVPEEPVLSVTQDQGVVFRDALERKINMSKDNTHTYKLVDPGDFIISLRSFQGGLEYSAIRGTVSPAYHVIRPRKPIIDVFYKHYFKSYEFIGRLAVAVIGIRDGKQISYGDFSFMKLPYPPVEQQKKIAKILDQADEEIRLERKNFDALKEQKKGLMQQLLTGKVRVKEG